MLPTFYVLGAQKAGTTWLFSTLSTHPEVGHATLKEVHYFDRAYRVKKGLKWYEKQFEKRSENYGKKAVGDFTPKYLRMVHPECVANNSAVPTDAMELLKAATPDAKFVVILRNPVRRALSAYQHYLRKGTIAIGTSILDTAPDLDLLLAGRYAEQLEIWFKHFPREQFLILIYEDDVNPDSMKAETFKRVCNFIGVDDSFTSENLYDKFNHIVNPFRTRLLNRGGIARRLFWDAPMWTQNLKIWDIKIDEQEVAALRDYYREPNQKLAELLGRELPW